MGAEHARRGRGVVAGSARPVIAGGMPTEDDVRVACRQRRRRVVARVVEGGVAGWLGREHGTGIAGR